MPDNRQSYIQGVLWAAAAILIWSGSLVLLRLGVTTRLNAYDLTAMRFGTAAALLAPALLRSALPRSRSDLTGALLMVCGFGAPYVLLISIALTTAPVSAAGTLNPGIMAICSVLFGALLFKDRIGLIHVCAIVCIASSALIPLIQTPGAVTEGHLVLILTGIMWAVYVMVLRWYKVSALTAAALVSVGSALLYLPVYMAFLPKQIHSAPLGHVLLQMGFQGILVSALAVYAFTRSTELLGPLAGAALPALIPVFTLGLGYTFLSEPVSAAELASSLLTGSGVAAILASPWLKAHCAGPALSRNTSSCLPRQESAQ